MSTTSPRHIIADINALLRAADTESTARAIAESLKELGLQEISVHIADVAAGCEPDNMLVTEYEQRFSMPPVVESLHRIVVGAQKGLGVDNSAVTSAIARALPAAPDGSEGLWYGSTRDGQLQEKDLSMPIACRLS